MDYFSLCTASRSPQTIPRTQASQRFHRIDILICVYLRSSAVKFLLAFLLLILPAVAEDSLDRDYATELPRIAPLEPAQALASFEVHPDFEMQLVAAEPLVHDPIAMAFDEKGRMFVVEMRGYSERREAMIGAIRLLTDVDGDGVYDKSDVYVDGLAWPTAVACFDGGIFVAEPPDIFYCKDTDGDNKADVREKVYTGFSLANVQGLLNTFLWGLDNRIHGATSSSGADVVKVGDTTAPPLSLRGRDFSFDPRTKDIRAESGGGQHGMTFDAVGRKFVCSNSDHIMQIMYDDAISARNPYMEYPSVRRSIAVEGPAADVYRISPVEPWREVRTRLRVQGLVPGPIEGGGTAAGYFTSATGVTVYKGDAWPEQYRGNVFIGDVGSNLIHRKIIEETGIQLTARRADPNTEFVRSRDNWFRPVQFANAPDGTLFVADMYREVIEHPDSLPPIIKQHLDLNSGEDRGRIYRIAPKGFKEPKIPDMGKATTAELVAYLDHPNAWHRETASRLIYEQQKKDEAVSALEKFLAGTPTSLWYIHAIYAMKGLGMQTGYIFDPLQQKEPWVRVHGVRLADYLLLQTKPPFKVGTTYLFLALSEMAQDKSVNVRYAATFAFASIALLPGGKDNLVELLYRLVQNDIGDEWMRFAIKNSSLAVAPELLDKMLLDENVGKEKYSREFLQSLSYFSGISAGENTAALLAKIDSLSDTSLKNELMSRIFDGLKESGNVGLHDTLKDAPSALKMLDEMLATVRNTAVNTGAPDALRVEALSTLTLDTYDSAKPMLTEVLKQAQASDEVRGKALHSLASFNSPDVADIIFSTWPSFGPTLRTQAIEVMFSRTDRIVKLLDAIDAKTFDPRALDATRRNALLKNEDKNIRERAATFIVASSAGKREEVVTRYAPALQMQGNAEKGKKIFMENCAQCHRFGGEGHNVGPDLATVVQSGAVKIMVNILDPNREVNPQYINYTIDTVDFETHTGIIVEESAGSVTLRRANDEGESILRNQIEKISSSEMSIMPEGQEETISVEAMADLLAYLTGG